MDVIVGLGAILVLAVALFYVAPAVERLIVTSEARKPSEEPASSSHSTGSDTPVAEGRHSARQPLS